MGRKTVTVEEIKNRLKHTHGNVISIVESTYKTPKEKATFVHVVHGSWEAVVNNVTRGSSHPFFGFYPLTIDQVEKKIFEVHGDNIVIIGNTYRGRLKKAGFIHKTEGYWETTVKSVLSGRSHINFKPKVLSREEVERRISNVHGETIKIYWDTYERADYPAKFYHFKYGDFICIPEKVFIGQGPKAGIMEKKIATSIARYGYSFPMQNKEISLKSAKFSNKCTIKVHWKTNEELVCQASYEPKVVDYLNNNKIDYLWQPQVFKMPNGRTYRPDLFLVESNTWVEIKGYFRKDALEKWDWFQSEYPNSELWNEKRLKEMGIL